MSVIRQILARQILDSRGNPTIEADVFTDSGCRGRAAVPSGASTGSREALELRDGDKKRYLGKSVTKAISHVRDIIAPALVGKKVQEQREIDHLMIQMDGTDYKSHLGANAILAVSLAVCRAAAEESKLPLYEYLFTRLQAPNKRGKYILPAPMMNIINGGQHASNNLDIQEFMILPHIAGNFAENLRAGVEVFHALKSTLHSKGYSTNVGDEGGFAPDLKSHEEAIELIMQAIETAGYKVSTDISLALDVAASEFYEDGVYRMQGKTYNSIEMIEYYARFLKNYPIISIEDPLAENDSEAWIKMTQTLGAKAMLVGDDLFVTNKKIFQSGIDRKMANAILIKLNQIGTLTETFDTISLAYAHNYSTIISHRSGETGDTFIADLSVATGSGFIKTGSSSRSDRVEKYNQLLRIEELLGPSSCFNRVK